MSAIVYRHDEFARTETGQVAVPVDLGDRLELDLMLVAPLVPEPDGGSQAPGTLPTRMTRYSAREVASLVHIARARLGCRVADRPTVADPAIDDPTLRLDHVSQPAYLLDVAGRLLNANGGGWRLLEKRHFGLSLAGVLSPDRHACATRMAVAVAAVARGEVDRDQLVVQRDRGNPFVVRVAAAERAGTALVLVHDPDAARPLDAALLQAYFGFTPTEAKLVAALIEHRNLRDTARSIAMRYATARTHLARIFEKSGTSSQAELTARVLRSGLF